MRPLVIDIETKPDSAVDTPEYWAWFQSNLEPPGNLKDPLKIQAALDDKVEKARGRMALSPITAMVSVIGLMPWNEETPIVLQAEQPAPQLFRQPGNLFENLLSASIALIVDRILK